jgi:hypothetical protein
MTEHHQSPSDLRGVERATILQLLRDDRDERWSRAELEAELGDVQHPLSDAIEQLARDGVVIAEGEHVVASRCVRHLDELGLVSV